MLAAAAESGVGAVGELIAKNGYTDGAEALKIRSTNLKNGVKTRR